MTPEEHQLIIEMLKEQRVVYAALVEVLKSRDIMQDKDLEAANSLLDQSGKTVILEKQIEDSYSKFAKILGVKIA
jgi:hypothetical protein